MSNNREMPPLPLAPEQSGADVYDEDKEIKPIANRGLIEVVALRDGFYKNQRIKEGHRFQVTDEKHLGTWMKCIDPVVQKKHAERIKGKADAINKASIGLNIIDAG